MFSQSDFHKDEVRQIGKSLGLPDWILNRHPFPGPGLAVRILCGDAEAITDPGYFDALSRLNRLCNALNDIDRHSVDQVTERLNAIRRGYGLQASVIPLLSVGVSGDSRSYMYPICVHCPNADLSSAEFWQMLSDIVQPLLKAVPNVNRMVYSFRDFSVRLDRRKCRLDSPTIEILRNCDDIISRVLDGCLQNVRQMPIVLLPVGSTEPSMFSLVVRPVYTEDFMTAYVPLPVIDIDWSALHRAISRCLDEQGDHICNVFYDLTTKPPGTTEWE